MRRSQRIQRIHEKYQKLLCSLPEHESDSENEGDQSSSESGSENEGDQDNTRKNADINNEEDYNELESEESYDLGESDCENEWEDIENNQNYSDEDVWSHNSNVLDQLTLSFEDNGCMLGKVEDKEIGFFTKIFDDAAVSQIIEQTNIYANQNNSTNWTDLTVDELKAYIGCHIIMGIHKLPQTQLYWSSDPMLRVSAVADTMTLKRFEKITQNWHINNNEHVLPKSHSEYDKLHKLRPLLDLLNKNIGKIYSPSSFVTIDESMIAFKGRCVLKQYMPLKPIKRGYKVWCLADAVTGFVIAFIVYTGWSLDVGF